MCFQQRIVAERLPRLFGLGQAKVARRYRIDPERLEQRANLAHLAGIMAGDDELAGGELADHLSPRRSVLRRENLAAADAREAEEAEQAFLVIGCALGRSEEHTSELQSLMRISYAVFCLKKK